MNRIGFKNWMDYTTELSEYSKGRYLGAPVIVDSWLAEWGYAYPSIYSINDIDIINEIKAIDLFRVKNRSGGNMYSAALNHYKSYLIYKSELVEAVEDIEFMNSVETNLTIINRENIDIIDSIEEVPQQTMNNNLAFKRNPKKPAEVIIDANFTCEVDANHNSFISKKTGENYCEGHHLIPMGQQINFNISLDVHANIVSLCPNCHRTLHHGVFEEKMPLLNQLYMIRNERLRTCGINISLEQLNNLYI